MGNVRISDLPAAIAAADSDLLEISKSGTSQRVTRAQLIAGRAAAGPVTSAGITMATARLIGRVSPGQGNPEELEFAPVALGGTGATNAATARINLGLGGMATQEPASVAITGGTIAGAAITNASLVTDTKGDLRDAPLRNQTAAYTAVLDDAGRMISISAGGVTIPADVFSAGKRFTIFNNSPLVQTINPASGVTLYLAGTQQVGGQSIAPRAFVDVECVAANAFVLSGNGLIIPNPDGVTLVAPNFLAPALTLQRAQLAGVRSSAMNAAGNGLVFYGADLPRFTGPAQRLLIEAQGTNTIRNPGAEGAIAGTPGTMPTNWTALGTAEGLSWNVAGVGFENNTPYVDIRLSGTSSSASSAIIRADQVYPVASVGQVWSHSVSIRVVSGSLTGISTVSLRVIEWTIDGTLLSFHNLAVSVGTLLQRQFITATLAQATVERVGSSISVNPQIGVAIDCTFRIIAPQLELGFPSSPILPPLTTLGVSTRGEDSPTALLASLGILANGACTVLWSGVIPALRPGGVHTIACLDDGSVNNRFTMRVDQASGQMQAVRALAGVTATANAGAVTAGTKFKAGMTPNGQGRLAVSLNGSAAVNVTGGPIASLTRLLLGNIAGSSAPLSGETERLRVLPYPVSDSEIANLTGAFP